MHFDQTFSRRDATVGAGFDADEIAANAFAASLLTPKVDLVKALESGVDSTDDSELRQLARRLACASRRWQSA